MSEEVYVSFETAKLLKEKGFDWKTIECYSPNGGNYRFSYGIAEICGIEQYPRPTLKTACKWLRDEKGIHPELELGTDNEFSFTIYRLDGKRTVLYEESHCWTKPEDAVEAALQYALTKLI